MKRAFFLLCGMLLLPLPVRSEPPEWHGSIKSLNLYGQESPADISPSYHFSSNRARFGMDWQPMGSWRLEAVVDDQYLWSDPSDTFSLPDRDINRLTGMDQVWQQGEHGTNRLQVDRLNLQLRVKAVDVSIGRQAFGFGRILIFSPLDVIAPFAPEAIDTEVRSGVDALRITFNYGIDGQLGALAVGGEKERYNSYLATWTDNRKGLDMLMIGGRLRGRNMFGAGLAGSLGTLGIKGEFAIHNGRDLDETGGDLHDHYALAAIETWYRFNNGVSLVAQYLYNGPGADDPKDYPEVLASAPLQEGLTYLLGRHYLLIAPTYDIHPLVTLQGLVIYNLTDNSALIRPTLDISLADNLSLQLFWSWHTGQGPHLLASGLAIEPRSEFGMLGDNGGLLLKWYF